MGAYATIDQIRASSPNIPAIVRGTDDDIARWALEAAVTINAHCRTNFSFEQQVEKTVELGAYPDVFLPRVVSGDMVVMRSVSGASRAVSASDYEVTPGEYGFRYTGSRPSGMGVTPSVLRIKADWGFAPSREFLLVTMANRLKANYTSHIGNTGSHSTEDAFNEVTLPDATDLDTAIELLNEVKNLLMQHCEYTSVHMITPAPVSLPDAVNEATAVTLATALKTVFNAHVRSTVWHAEADDANVISISVTNVILPDEIRLAFTKVVGRVAIRDNAEDIRYQNAGFDSESFGDGYSYRVSEARAHLITPSEMALLHEYVNEGRVAY